MTTAAASAPLPPLAQIDDLPGAGAFTPDQAASAAAALERASAAVRAYCRRAFTARQVTTRIRARGDYLLLEQRPVASVDRVAIVVLGEPTVISGWVWDGLDRVWIGGIGIVINLPELVFESAAYGPTVADVTYTAGYEQVPADVAAVVAGLGSRALSVPAGGALASQTTGPFSYSVASWAQGGPLALSDADKAILGQYRRGGGTVELRS